MQRYTSVQRLTFDTCSCFTFAKDGFASAEIRRRFLPTGADLLNLWSIILSWYAETNLENGSRTNVNTNEFLILDERKLLNDKYFLLYL